jgi:UDP-glucose 4-epimerase
MGKKVVVFGGSGFLGSHLVKLLSRNGYDVLAADINASEHIPEACFQYCDILNTTEVEKLVKGSDIIFNFAGYANLDTAIHDPLNTIELNVMGNLNILEAMRKFGTQRFIYASSAYAMNDKASFYGLSKLTSEKLVEEYGKRFDLKFSIIRFGSVYSEFDYDNNYIYNLVKSAIREKRIIHPGDGEELREYIHAHDAATLSLKILENDKYIGQHIILTGLEKVKRKDLFLMIKEIMNSDIEIVFQGGGYNHHYQQTPYQFQPVLSMKLIANPYIDLGQGILQCIQNVKEDLNEE